MERLTERCAEGIRIKGCSTLYANKERKGAPASNAIVRLAAYEDTGLEPEEILTGKELAEVACAVNLLKEYQAIGPIGRFREIAQAEKDGRLAVLPCKVGDVVWVNDGCVEDWSGKPLPYKCLVYGIEITEKERRFHVECYNTGRVFPFDFNKVGETVFLAREEAEAALKRKEEEDNAAN